MALSVLASGCGGAKRAGNAKTGKATTTATRQSNTARRAAVREARLEAQVRRLIPIAKTSHAASRKQSLRGADAESQLELIAGQSLKAVRPLVQALKRRDCRLIGDLPDFYVALGRPGSERTLAECVGQLYPTGSSRYGYLPFAFLGTGNGKLDRLVTEELRRHGYTVSGRPSNVLRWGSSGAYGGG